MQLEWSVVSEKASFLERTMNQLTDRAQTPAIS
jgi:hypothetical protein